MASLKPKGDIESVIEALCLTNYYPEKLTRQDLYEISDLSIQESENVTQQNIAWHFINRITRLNYQARSLKIIQSEIKTKHVGFLKRRAQEKAETTTQCHPLDVLVSVFLCCDPTAKQDLVQFLWNCKLAVPFSLQPETTQSQVLYYWPLRQLVTKYQNNGDTLSKEFRIIDIPMQHVGFIRIGDSDESKSALINGIMGGSEKTHPTFFHRHLPNSKKQRSNVVNGLVEISWFFPKGSDTDVFQQSISFLNLRGNSKQLTNQFTLLCQILDILVIICQENYLHESIEMVRTVLRDHKCSIILVLSDSSMEQSENDIIDKFIDKIQPFDEVKLEIIQLESFMFAEKIDAIRDEIKTKVKRHSVDMTSLDLKTKFVLCKVDETDNISIKTGKESAYSLIKTIKKCKEGSRKQTILPLQGNSWIKWSEADIEIHRLENFHKLGQKGDTQSYLNSLETTKYDYRQKQFECIDSLSTVMQDFLAHCIDLTGLQLQIYLRSLKFGLDDIEREMIQPIFTESENILQMKTSASKEECEALNEQLLELDKRKAKLSFGIEHLSREIGQIFEACISQKNKNYLIKLPEFSRKITCGQLTLIAVKLLLNGFPVEIMDGDVGYVPEVWVRQLLKKTREQLIVQEEKEVLVHVISVLGIQSSGKSTLLNTMFGLQFPVSAGRCTKGVFMQLVKISTFLRERIGCDYLIVIDTEGLRSAHLSSERSVKFDNELSCFSIGLADNTIVNLMGENASYLEENLPIVVHAFLRMEMAGLTPSCSIIHHNVDKSNKDKLMEQNRLLEKVLNDLTAKACSIELIPSKQFKEIIKFDVNCQTDYIPSLFEGEQPMTAISLCYSQECNTLRRKILKEIEQISRRFNIRQFASHLDNLWKAIKKDQFVFEFKSTLETEAKLYFDDFYCKLLNRLIEETTKLVQMYEGEISKQSKYADNQIQLSHQLDEVFSSHREKCCNFFIDPNNLLNAICCKWQEEMLSKFDNDCEQLRQDCLMIFKQKPAEEFNSISEDTFSSEDMGSLDSLICSKDGKLESSGNIWNEWKCLIASRKKKDYDQQGNEKLPTLVGVAEKLLYNEFSSVKRLIRNELEKKKLIQWSLDEFTVEWRHVQTTSKNYNKYIHLKQEVAVIAQQIITSAKETLNYAKVKQMDSRLTIKRILVEMKDVITRKKNIVKTILIAELSIAIAGYSVVELLHINKHRMSEENLKCKLEENKLFYTAIIEKRLGKTIDEIRTSAIIVYDTVISYVSESAALPLTHLPSEFRKLKLKSKKEILLSFLKSSIDDVSLIELYMADPPQAIQKYLPSLIRSIHIQSYLMKQSMKAIQQIEDTLSQIEKKQKNEKLDTWMRLLMPGFSVCESKIKNMPSTNTLEIGKHLLKLIRDSAEIKIKIKISGRILKLRSVFKSEIAKTFMKTYFGCCLCCPFCNEICQYSTQNHVGDHKSLLHRPIGLKGFYYTSTKKISLETCENHAATNNTITTLGTKIAFKDYKTVFPYWRIHPDPTLESSAFWKWYIVNNKETLLKWFRSDIELPSAWKCITKDMVYEQLSET